MLPNQTSIAGPKTAPMPAVPRFCARNKPMRIATVTGRTKGWKRVVATSRPSTADRTLMAGVMMPSP